MSDSERGNEAEQATSSRSDKEESECAMDQSEGREEESLPGKGHDICTLYRYFM